MVGLVEGYLRALSLSSSRGMTRKERWGCSHVVRGPDWVPLAVSWVVMGMVGRVVCWGRLARRVWVVKLPILIQWCLVVKQHVVMIKNVVVIVPTQTR